MLLTKYLLNTYYIVGNMRNFKVISRSYKVQSVDGEIKMYVPTNEENSKCMFSSILIVKINYMGNLVKDFTLLDNGKGGALKKTST